MNHYPKYKPSGIEWIGNIPEHWEVRKISRSFNLISSGTTPKADNEKYYNNGTVNWINTGDLNDGILFLTEKKVTEKALQDHSGLKVFPNGTLLIAMYGATIGKIAILGKEGCTNQACCALSDSNYFETKLVFYWFNANKSNIINLAYGGGQQNISQEIIKFLKIPCPTIKEQKAIVLFLDNKTSLIDEAISKKRQLIELLKEERTALINHAVTKGINPDVKLKPSGIEWLGDIPEHWEVKKLKYVADVQSSNVDKKSIEGEEDVQLCNYVDVYKNEYIDSSIPFMTATATLNEIQKFKLAINDVLITKDSETPTDIAVPALVKYENTKLLCGYHLAQIRSNKNLLGEYLFRLFQSKKFNSVFETAANGITRYGLGIESIKGVSIPIPSIDDQRRIVKFILDNSNRIYSAIEKIIIEITLLQEYRTSLINEAVTGKICVV